MPETELVVYCTTHRHYLRHAGVTGTTWTTDQDKARRYSTKPAARKAAGIATWNNHRPTPWSLPSKEATL